MATCKVHVKGARNDILKQTNPEMLEAGNSDWPKGIHKRLWDAARKVAPGQQVDLP